MNYTYLNLMIHQASESLLEIYETILVIIIIIIIMQLDGL